MPEKDATHHDQYLKNYLSSGTARIIGIGRDVEAKRRDGTTFPMHLSVGEAQFNGHRHFIGICHDLTDYRNALHRMATAEQRYRGIVDSQNQLICRIDQKLRITFANLTFSRCMNASVQQLIGIPLHQLAYDHHPNQLNELLQSAFHMARENRPVTLKLTMKGEGEERVVVAWSFSLTGKTEGIGSELQGLGIDVSEFEKVRSRADFLQNHDALTGLLNKAAFMDELATWQQAGTTFSMLHIDIENFGLINQKFGYKAGNSVLKSFSSHVRNCVGRNGLCARVGADDFLAAVPITETSELVNFIELFNQELGQIYFDESRSIRLDTLIGMASFPGDAKTIERLPDLAEAAMRDARKRHEAYAFFNESSQRKLERQLDIQQGLTHALETDRLTIALQPKWHALEKTIAGFEVLIRWFDSDLGQISPAEFVPVAERSKLGQQLDRYVIQKALDIAQTLATRGQTRLPLAVNITASHFSNPAFPDFVLSEIKRANLPAECLELEITEGVLLDNSRHQRNTLARLREAGIKVAIDDFGTGYSSLAYLGKLNVDELKIDKEFISTVTSPRGRTLVQSVISIAKAYELKVTAEGVETEAQLIALQEMGCDLIQGYYLSRPLPVAEALTLTATSSPP